MAIPYGQIQFLVTWRINVAFKISLVGKKAPRGNQFVRCQTIFDIKMEDFRCMARFVAGGHMAEAPATITCASVVFI